MLACSIAHPGNIFSTRGFVVVDVDPLQLQVGSLAGVGAGGVDTMLITAIKMKRSNNMKQPDDLPELSADLVPTLASLDVHDLSHLGQIK